MKLKQNAIKPGMVIHCPKEDDADKLLDHLAHLGYGIPSDLVDGEDDICYFVGGEGQKFAITSNTKMAYFQAGRKITEFSDLIEPDNDALYGSWNKLGQECYQCPKCSYISQTASDFCPGCGKNMYDDSPTEMSAIDLLKWFREHGNDNDLLVKLFDGDIGFYTITSHHTSRDILKRIAAYEAAKKTPKPMEVEWVDVCRIIQIQDNGFKKCVYEVDLRDDVDPHVQTEENLKDYIAEHDGRYIAVVEDICRVKEDK